MTLAIKIKCLLLLGLNSHVWNTVCIVNDSFHSILSGNMYTVKIKYHANTGHYLYMETNT